MNYSFFIIKPDSIENNQEFEILDYISKNGFVIETFKETILPIDIVKKHYIEHKDKPFYNILVNFLCNKKIFLGIVSGLGNVVEKFRNIVGITDCKKAKRFTIRHIFAFKKRDVSTINIMRNAIHCSDSIESAKREIKLFKNQISLDNKILKFIK